METDSDGDTVAVYTYGNGLITMNRADANSYYHYDGLGSTRQLTNSSETVTKSYIYDSFGNLIASSGSSANPYGFTGESQFGEADGLVFLRARYYRPNIGRFISRDPIRYEDGMNLYAYVHNNPINGTDPLGLAGCGPGWIGEINPDFWFKPCCDKHDDCYGGKGPGGCNTSKEKCDNDFCKCVFKKCLWSPDTCSRAALYCALVKAFGKSAFDKARKNAGCCP